MAPGQRPGGPFNPMNRSKLLKGTGRGSVQLRNTHTTQCSYGRKSKLHSAGQPQTAATGVRYARAFVKHDSSSWIPELWPVRTPLRTSFGASPVSATTSSQQQSHRPSFDLEQSEIPIPDEPAGPEHVAMEGFLDACFEATASGSSDSAACNTSQPSLQHAFAVAPARVATSNDASNAILKPDTDSSPAAIRSSSSRDSTLATTSTSSGICNDFAAPSTGCVDASSDSASFCDSIASPSIASDCRSVLDSYPANVVASILCPRALSGHLIGRNGQTAASLQLPGARWWLTDKAWKFGGTSNLRLIMIQGTPSNVAEAFARVLSHVTCENAPRNSQFFKTRQGLVKAKVVLQSWLVGTVIGKGGSTIRKIMLQSGAQMQVTSVLAAVDSRKQSSSVGRLDEESALQIAAPSVSALTTCIRLIFEAIRKNPCYKPVSFKSVSDYKLLKAA